MKQVVERRRPRPTAEVMSTVCFRVTRACNLGCSYCQAPPNQRQLPYSQLVESLAFLAKRGAQRIKFTGGEPFVHHQLLPLIFECRKKGMEPTIVTNGTLLTEAHLEALRAAIARVKISLHGPRERHDSLQGRPVYDTILANARKLISAGIETSVHTLLHREYELDLRKWIEFLASEEVHKVSFMTFVPRGRGRELEERWAFNDEELEELSQHIAELTEFYREQITVRFLDFARQPYLVFETDGRFVWEVGPETLDAQLQDSDQLYPLNKIRGL
ncbi:MAG TPA: radical SAM protein [Terriglobales bacterium]